LAAATDPSGDVDAAADAGVYGIDPANGLSLAAGRWTWGRFYLTFSAETYG
jgi:hypothetical protein